MNPSKNDFLAKDEDDEGDACHQTCTSIGHRVCNPSLINQLLYQNELTNLYFKATFLDELLI